MLGLNKAYLIGHVGADPELRTSAKGIQVCRVRIATRNARKVEGAWVESTDWHSVTCFGRTAELIARSVRTGDALGLECVLRPHKWTTQDGQPRYENDVVAERILAHQPKDRRATEGLTPTPRELTPDEDVPTDLGMDEAVA